MVLILVIFDHNVCFCGNYYHTVLVLYNLRVLYNVKFIGGGIHVIEAFIRSLMVGGHRSISLTGIVPQNVMTQNSSQNKSNFCVERTIYV